MVHRFNEITARGHLVSGHLIVSTTPPNACIRRSISGEMYEQVLEVCPTVWRPMAYLPAGEYFLLTEYVAMLSAERTRAVGTLQVELEKLREKLEKAENDKKALLYHQSCDRKLINDLREKNNELLKRWGSNSRKVKLTEEESRQVYRMALPNWLLSKFDLQVSYAELHDAMQLGKYEWVKEQLAAKAEK